MKLFSLRRNESERKQTEQEQPERPIAAEPAAAEPEEAGEKEKREDKFALEFEPDGVYLTLSSSRPITSQEQAELVRHISRKQIRDVNMEEISAAVSGQWAEHQYIAPPQQEHIYDEVMTVVVSLDGMSAAMTVQPPEAKVGKRLTYEDIVYELEHIHRITYGMDAARITRFMVAPEYDTPIMIARGKPPVRGEDGRLEWNVERRSGEDTYRVKTVAENEKIDYKNLDLFVQVEKDQLLVTRVPPKQGTPGYTVAGREIPAESGKNYTLPRGKNTYVTSDGLQLRASKPGRVEEVKGNLEINQLYHIKGNVDMSVGNIDFNGDVLIEGNVLGGFTIRATGSIEIRGIVEGSVVEAGRDLVIRGGVQGANKGVIKAGEELYAKFVEYGTVEAGRLISVEYLLHSEVNCFGAIEAMSGRASIIGGHTCAGSYIAAYHYGNSSGRPTSIEVGVSPTHRLKMAEMESSLAAMKAEIAKLQAYVDELSGPGSKTQAEMAHRMATVRTLLKKQREMLELQEELNELKGDMEDEHEGMIHALNMVNPGVTVTIGLSRLSVSSPLTFATFREKESKVDFTACRFKQSPMRKKNKRR